MAVTISDVIESFNADGTSATTDGLSVYAYPLQNTVMRKDVGGTFRPIQANSNLPAAYQYGESVLTAGGGLFSLVLPDSTQQYPATQQWALVLPDGKTYVGVPPANGTYNVYQLVSAQGWVQQNVQGVAPSSTGSEAAGEVLLSGQDTYVVLFQNPMSSASYTIAVGLQVDPSVGGGPEWRWSGRSKTGFTINLTQGYNGILTWRAKVE